MSDSHGAGEGSKPRRDDRPHRSGPSTTPRPTPGGGRRRVWSRGRDATSPRRSDLLKRPEDACFAFGRDGHRLTIYRAGIDAEVMETVSEGPLMLALSVA